MWLDVEGHCKLCVVVVLRLGDIVCVLYLLYRFMGQKQSINWFIYRTRINRIILPFPTCCDM